MPNLDPDTALFNRCVALVPADADAGWHLDNAEVQKELVEAMEASVDHKTDERLYSIYRDASAAGRAAIDVFLQELCGCGFPTLLARSMAIDEDSE
jgi:hypothetical protein